MLSLPNFPNVGWPTFKQTESPIQEVITHNVSLSSVKEIPRMYHMCQNHATAEKT